MSTKKKLLQAAAGTAAAAASGTSTHVEDVYSTRLWSGKGTNDALFIETGLNTLNHPEFSGRQGNGFDDDTNLITSSHYDLDSSGNIYVVANTKSDRDGAQQYTVVRKYTPHFKEVTWAKTFGHPTLNDDIGAPHITVSENGNVYLHGQFEYTNGTGSGIARLNATNGSIIWKKVLNNNFGDTGEAISEDSSGTYVYFAHGDYSTGGIAQGISKFAVSDGSNSWRKRLYWGANDSNSVGNGNSVVYLNSHIYTVGLVRNGSTRLSSLTKWNEDGTHESTISWTGTSGSVSQAFAITTDGTDLYITGNTTGKGYYLAKYNQSLTQSYLIHYWDAPSSDNLYGRNIVYKDNYVWVTGGGNPPNAAYGNHTAGAWAVKHNASTGAQVSTSKKHIALISDANEPVLRLGGDKAIWFNNKSGYRSDSFLYRDIACYFKLSDFENLKASQYLPYLADATFDSSDTTTSSSSQTVTTSTSSFTWGNATLVDEEEQQPLQETIEYYPETDETNNGGLAWLKRRHAAEEHRLFDTERIINNRHQSLATNVSTSESNQTNIFNGFGMTGWNLGTDSSVATSSYENVSWNFKRHENFFDIVTYTGTGSNQTINHNLGSAPGFIMIKNRDANDNWICFHRMLNGGSNPATKYIMFTNGTEATANTGWFQQTTPTADSFFVGSQAAVNTSNEKYVAYLFAHHDGDGTFGDDADQDIIHCGSFTTNSSGFADVNIGFEPQWVMTKVRTNTSQPWQIVDMFRGSGFLSESDNSTSYANVLHGNEQDAETASTRHLSFRPNGFKYNNVDSNFNSKNFIFVAIRRPTRKPTRSTDVFDITRYGSSNGDNRELLFNLNYADTFMGRNFSSTSSRGLIIGNKQWSSGVRNLNPSGPAKYMGSTATNVYADGDSYEGFDRYPRVYVGNDATARLNYSSMDQVMYAFARAPGFYDTIMYQGSGSTNTVPHNLGVVPEMIWYKAIGNVAWRIHTDFTDTNHVQVNINNDNLNGTANYANGNELASKPTDSQIVLGTGSSEVNNGSYDYLAMLFASRDGVSKLGEYTGDGTTDFSKTIDCGFTKGIKFLIIKAKSTSGDWHVFDVGMGIRSDGTAYNYYFLNTSDGPLTTTEVETRVSGFAVKAGSSNNINTSNVTYLFYAISG